MRRNRRNRSPSYVEIYRDITNTRLNILLLLVFLVFTTLPNILHCLISPNWFNVPVSIFGSLMIIFSIRNLIKLRREQKLLLSGSEAGAIQLEFQNESDQRPIYWFNRL